MSLVVIGDIHGKTDKYLELTQQHEYTLQLGDFGFSGDYNVLQFVDSLHHRFFMGNHDGYNAFTSTLESKHNLGHFGSVTIGGISLFFIRGGFSIDWYKREVGIDFFLEEELDDDQMGHCLASYAINKPEIVISHECPYIPCQIMFPNKFILNKWGYGDDWGSPTQHFMEECFILHQPKLWVFGHHHVSRDRKIDGTRFICLPELGTFEIKE